MRPYYLVGLLLISLSFFAQSNDTVQKISPKKEINALKFELNQSGSHYFQATFLNQTWVRYNENNDSSTVFNHLQNTTTDVGLRRTRIQLFGQITDRTFIYFQFGQNNYNTAFNYTGNRKLAAFFHDALCEYEVSKDNALKLGAGLTVLNGLSRFSQPSVGSIMTMDVPVFLQYSVDQIDQFDRRLAVFARGQIKGLDYRIYMSDPYPINSNGSAAPAISKNANFVNTAAFPAGKSPGINKQFGGYLAYNFFDTEPHTTPYMTGTYLGQKKIWNVAIGSVYQKNATWYLAKNDNGAFADTTLSDMLHLGIETYLDMPLNKVSGTAVSAFAGYYNTNYGYRYLRYNGAMNPSTGGLSKTMLQSGAYGNAFPMFGSGQIVYAQFGMLLPETLLGKGHGKLMPYISAQYADYTALHHKAMVVANGGLNWLIKGHNSKLTLDYQNRPTFYTYGNSDVQWGKRKSAIVLQYQLFI